MQNVQRSSIEIALQFLKEVENSQDAAVLQNMTWPETIPPPPTNNAE